MIDRQSWRTFEEVEYGTSEWVDWCNRRRLHGACEYLSPAVYEAAYYDRLEAEPDPPVPAAGVPA